MKKITTLIAALLIGVAGSAFAQKQETPKPTAVPVAKPAAAPEIGRAHV